MIWMDSIRDETFERRTRIESWSAITKGCGAQDGLHLDGDVLSGGSRGTGMA